MNDFIINFKIQDLLEFINANKEKGYNIYSNINNIEELIDIITIWYKFKYPKDKIESIKNGYLQEPNIDLITIKEKLSNEMSYTELMFRIPKHLHPIIECWYRPIDEEDQENDLIKTCIFNKNTMLKNKIYFSINKYDGYFYISSNVTINEYLGIPCQTIDQFIKNYKKISKFDYSIIDFTNPEQIVATHDLNLELRDKIFDLILLKLFDSDKDQIIGYIRAKKFAEEFNKYIYGLNISLKDIDSIISIGSYSEFNQLINYIIKILEKNKTDKTEIEELGLTFHTLELLKSKNVETISDLIENINGPIMNYKFKFEANIPSRDKNIINAIKINEITHSLVESVKEYDSKPEKTRKKGIFRKK